MLLSDAAIAITSALLGGGALQLLWKAFERLTNRGERRRTREADEAARMRQELRADVDLLRAALADVRQELDELREEVDSWRDRYYALLGEYVELNARCKSLESELHQFRSGQSG